MKIDNVLVPFCEKLGGLKKLDRFRFGPQKNCPDVDMTSVTGTETSKGAASKTAAVSETTHPVELVEAATLVATEMAAEAPLTVAPVEATALTSFLRMLCRTA